MNDQPSEKVISTVVRRALLREALQKMEAGERLYDGRWMSDDAYRAARLATRFAHFRETVEALLFWGLGGLLGLGFMVLVLAIL